MGQMEVVQECEDVSRKWGRSVRIQQVVRHECESASKEWGRSVTGSARSGTGV